MKAAFRVVAFGFVAACDGGGADETGIGEADVTLAQVQAVFDAECTACHANGANADGGMDLTLGVEVVAVDVASTEVTTMVRIAPGSLEDSYLWHKLQGTAPSVGGVDSQMPFDGSAPLSTEQLSLIEDWILAGAPTD